MTLAIEQLEAVLRTLPPPEGELSPRVALGAAPAGGLRLDQLDQPTLGDWLEDEMARTEGGDRKLGAAYLIGRLAWSLARGLAALALSDAWARALPPAAVSFGRRPVRWERDGESGIVKVADLWLNPAAAHFAGEAADSGPAFRQALEASMLPLVNALHAQSGLPRPALWRLVGDSLSAAFLAQGKTLDCAERAMALVLPMLRHKGSPLFSKQTEFIRVTLPERQSVSDWFRARGGCCRYYTAKGGEYCTTCVLRDPQSRDARLVDHLRRTHDDKAA